jgi:cysteine desulfurase / selenocysteine lyase
MTPSFICEYPSDLSLKKLRQQFPVTGYKIYLNHAGCSPYSSYVKKALDDYIDESYGVVVEDYNKNLSVREDLRSLIARLINADPDHVGFVKNTSSGLSLLASGLEWHAGDRIILADCEFPSNIYPFLNLERQGVAVDFIPGRKKLNGFIDIDSIQSLITEKTRLISLSFVEFSNGYRNDLQAIGDLCKQYNLIFCVDGIQGIGSLPIDVQSCNIHFISCATHKWLMGPQGIAFIYIHPDLLNKIFMTQVGWLSVKGAWNFFDYRLDLLDDARRFEIGTENWLGIYGSLASVKLLMELGIENIEKHILQLTENLINGLTELGLKTISSTNDKHRSGIVSFVFPGSRHNRILKLFESLNQNKIITALRDNCIRISPHCYNTAEEMDLVIQAVKRFTESNQ